MLAALPASAQLRVVYPPDALVAGRPANLFVEWEGTEALRALEIEVPAAWRLHSAHALRHGTRALVPLIAEPLGEGRYEVGANEPLRGRHRLVLGLEVGGEPGERAVVLTAGRDGGPREEWKVRVNAPQPPTSNRAFRLRDGAEPVALRRSALPGLGMRDAYTLELWVRTVGLDEILLSTWDGDEARPYPIEVVVDARGQLVAYRGRPGRHESLTSAWPVADGRWHHVALVNDPAAGRMRLFVDGARADSLRIDESEVAMNTMSLVLGGRPGRPGVSQARPFSGLLDELRLWAEARSAPALRRTMRVPLDDLAAGPLRLGFDRPIPPGLLLSDPARDVLVPSDLAFSFDVEALDASVEGGIVTLTWQTKDRRAEAFTVERSTDGRRFEPVGTVAAADVVSESADGAARFVHTDLPPGGQVLYYRVRQALEGGAERVSAALKLGLGATGAAPVAIVGNAPNPFRNATTITYELGSAQPVELSVWDVSGTRVALLLDEVQAAGRHALRFAADDLPSGVYFVRLETPAGTAVHKMVRTR